MQHGVDDGGFAVGRAAEKGDLHVISGQNLVDAVDFAGILGDGIRRLGRQNFRLFRLQLFQELVSFAAVRSHVHEYLVDFSDRGKI